MNRYGHVPQYPYAKDEVPQYPPYAMNPMSHPAAAMGPPGAVPHFQHSVKYGHRQPHLEPVNYGAKYDKEMPHYDYGHGGWHNGAPPDVPHDYYAVEVPPRGPVPYQAEMKTEYVPTYRPDHTQAQNSWDSQPMTQYANVRLAVFVENCTAPYELVESDLRELFSYYSGVSSLSISPDYPAAELIVTDQSASAVASSELNGIVLSGVGTLRCVVMRPGQTLESILATANVHKTQPQPQQDSRYAYADQPERKPAGAYTAMEGPAQQTAPAPAKGFERNLTVDGVEHVAGITNRPNTKRLARFELVELFSFEPDFDVTGTILGPNTTNIEYIMKNSDNKVDINIKGKPLNSAPVADRLHVSISSQDFYAYNKAMFMVEDLLSSVCEKYVDYIKDRGKVVSNLIGFRRHEYEEDASGALDYKGVVDKPKTWLDNGGRRYAYKAAAYRGGFKKVSERGRPMPAAPRAAPSSRSRGIRK